MSGGKFFSSKKAAVGFVLLLVILCAASAWTAAAIAGNRAETEREELFAWSVHRAYSALDAYDAPAVIATGSTPQPPFTPLPS